MAFRFKPRHFGNALLVVVATIAGYLIIEALVFPAVLPHLPLHLHQYVGNLDVLTQSSKRATEPEDYIALVGDSYAKGNGDWLLDADPNANGPFHSAHVLHDLTGRDVISFGAPNAGSLKGFVFAPQIQFRAVNRSPWYALEPPQTIVAYVYEGNDFVDNINRLRQFGLSTTDGARPIDPATVEAALAKLDRRAQSALAPSLAPALSFAKDAIVGTYRTLGRNGGDGVTGHAEWQRPPVWPPQPPVDDTSPPTVAMVAGKTTTLPAHLHSPALELDAAEIESALVPMRIALVILRGMFPDARLIVIYVPSPLATYPLVSETVSAMTHLQRATVFAADKVMPQSDRLCRLVADAADDAGTEFLDARPAIQQAGTREVLHGPQDWEHFNRAGYTVLAEAVHGHLQQPEGETGDCAALAEISDRS